MASPPRSFSYRAVAALMGALGVTGTFGALALASTPAADGPRAAPEGPRPAVAVTDAPRAAASLASDISPEPASSAGHDDGDRGGVWAVVVGVDEYPDGMIDLRAGEADALDVDATLAEAGVPEARRRVLLGASATRSEFEAALEWLVANAGPDSTAVVFFSGHVQALEGLDDGDGEAVDEAFVFGTGERMSDGEFAAALSGLRAGRTWIAVAGCFSEGFDDALAPGRLLTAASPEADLAYENDDYGRSYLVEFVIRRQILEGDAPSVQAAFDAGVDELRGAHPNRLPVMVDRLGEPLSLTR